MSRLIDADKIQFSEIDEIGGEYEPYLGCSKSQIDNLPTVEAIPIAEVKKFLEEGTKNVSNGVLAIVREDYIHKADYENRLKADLEAILVDLQMEIEGLETIGNTWELAIKDDCKELIQQKINSLKAESEPKESEGNND